MLYMTFSKNKKIVFLLNLNFLQKKICKNNLVGIKNISNSYIIFVLGEIR